MYSRGKLLGLFLGPALFALILLLPTPEGMPVAAQRCAAVTVLMATWWITECIPIPATSLLPIVLFPFLAIMPSSKATLPYANHLIYLFMGGFFIAVTMERWNLHRRIAMHTIRIMGTSPSRIILGFMVATAFLSMWVSNTATTMMMVPIGLAIIKSTMSLDREIDASELRNNRFATALMLGIAYAASIGGVGTIIGTPPNTVMVAQLDKLYGHTISFAGWMALGVPLSIIFLILTWIVLTKIVFPIKGDILQGRGQEVIRTEIAKLGAMKKEEKIIVLVGSIVATTWIVMGFFAKTALFKNVSDASIGIAGALLFFIIPSNLKEGRFMLDWKTAVKIPWDVILLFGGGLALADGFQNTGLAAWLAGLLVALKGVPLIVAILAVTLLVIFLTEITSNTAVATLMIPIMAATAIALGVHPYATIVPACIAASYAFMLPVATPPNAVIFGSGAVTIGQMARTGFILNIVGTFLITGFVYYVMAWIFGLELTVIPEWAMAQVPPAQ
ncbi:SLC13 family permease [Desulfocurvibacter africanus]|uniref:Anion transporter n=1 Tax=Desulfocurvibacter africanus subsp. africanus str. Walvis Bay TaxID=690850 RepID=F3YUJ5_DESAF|nr:DASS family sodium-coupled anion symporter [Desulfocurvibacter africanus]EGJ48949.1 anion transporter [Desulfocurvibacter africanus subsp. africanus str. Walvis Bay]